MPLKTEEILKNDTIVRKRFPTAQMMKLGEDCLIWTDGYAKVAILKSGSVLKFVNDKKG